MNTIKKNNEIKNLTAASICLALCMLLPFLTGQIPHIGQALAPMHIPVLLCAFICGPRYATIVGLTSPILRLMILGMPPPFMAITMCFELAAYGLVAGVLYMLLPKKPLYIYVSLIAAMLFGRIIWGLAALQLSLSAVFPALPFGWESFNWDVFLSAAFITAVPGIILHIVLIPLVVLALQKARIIVNEE